VVPSGAAIWNEVVYKCVSVFFEAEIDLGIKEYLLLSNITHLHI
jgi:hypothetical protein